MSDRSCNLAISKQIGQSEVSVCYYGSVKTLPSAVTSDPFSGGWLPLADCETYEILADNVIPKV